MHWHIFQNHQCRNSRAILQSGNIRRFHPCTIRDITLCQTLSMSLCHQFLDNLIRMTRHFFCIASTYACNLLADLFPLLVISQNFKFYAIHIFSYIVFFHNSYPSSMLLITLLFHIISLMIVSFKICCKEYLFIYKVPEF